MPLTPLHLAAGLPARRHISLKAFVVVNVLIDLEPASVMFFGMDRLGYALHQGVHTFGGVTHGYSHITCGTSMQRKMAALATRGTSWRLFARITRCVSA
jgi:hypothetical protein